MRGELYPTTVRHIAARGLKYYINSAGGFIQKQKVTYVVYANGDVARTKKFYFQFYPRTRCEVIILKPEKNPKATQTLNFTTGLELYYWL